MKRFLPILTLAVPDAAMAQMNGPAPSDPMIIVTGQGLPLPPGTPAYGAAIIDRERLLNTASGRIENVLADVAGFQSFRRSDSRASNPSNQGATLRALGGNASTRTLVLLDGVPVADPFFGYIPFSALVPDRLAGIRVTRGGGAGAFGAGAVAGIIELASATRDQLPYISASAAYGSRDASEVSFGLSPNLGNGFATLSGRWDRGDGFPTTPPSQRGVATVPAAYDAWSINLRGVAPLSATSEVQFRGTVFHDQRTLRFRGADSASEGQDASVRLVSRGAWPFEALAYIQARNFANVVISSTSFRKSLDQKNTPSTGLGGKVELRPPVGPDHVLRVGADTRLARGDMFEDAYNAGLASNPVTSRRHAGGQQVTSGLFVEDDWTLGQLIFTGGARADRWTITDGFYLSRNAAGAITRNDRYASRSDWQFSGRAGALLHLGEAFAIRGAAYTGFRLPTLNELYRPFVVFPITTNANAALRPEKLKGIEAGVDATPLPGVTLAATVFYNRLDNAIANVTVDATTRERRNIDRIVAKGIELMANSRSGDLALTASYAYSVSRARAPGQPFDGFSPAQSPRHAGSATLVWAPQDGPSLSATLRYVGRQFEDDLQSDALPDALTVDAVARLPLGHGVAITVRGENLLDETIVTRNAGGSTDLGTPRSVWIGVSFTG